MGTHTNDLPSEYHIFYSVCALKGEVRLAAPPSSFSSLISLVPSMWSYILAYTFCDPYRSSKRYEPISMPSYTKTGEMLLSVTRTFTASMLRIDSYSYSPPKHRIMSSPIIPNTQLDRGFCIFEKFAFWLNAKPS